MRFGTFSNYIETPRQLQQEYFRRLGTNLSARTVLRWCGLTEQEYQIIYDILTNNDKRLRENYPEERDALRAKINSRKKDREDV